MLHDCVKRQKLSLTRNTVEKAPEITPMDEDIQNNENYPKNNNQINKPNSTSKKAKKSSTYKSNQGEKTHEKIKKLKKPKETADLNIKKNSKSKSDFNSKILRCDRCEKSFIEPYGLKLHIARQHETEKKSAKSPSLMHLDKLFKSKDTFSEFKVVNSNQEDIMSLDSEKNMISPVSSKSLKQVVTGAKRTKTDSNSKENESIGSPMKRLKTNLIRLATNEKIEESVKKLEKNPLSKTKDAFIDVENSDEDDIMILDTEKSLESPMVSAKSLVKITDANTTKIDLTSNQKNVTASPMKGSFKTNLIKFATNENNQENVKKVDDDDIVILDSEEDFKPPVSTGNNESLTEYSKKQKDDQIKKDEFVKPSKKVVDENTEAEDDIEIIDESITKRYKTKCKYYCKKCSYSSYDTDDMFKHTKVHEMEIISEKNINKTKNIEQLKEYYKKINSMNSKIKTDCYVCGNDFQNRQQLLKHMKKDHGKSPLICAICNFECFDQTTKEMHRCFNKDSETANSL